MDDKTKDKNNNGKSIKMCFTYFVGLITVGLTLYVIIANLFFGDGMIMSVEEDNDDYKGYLDCSLTDSQME